MSNSLANWNSFLKRSSNSRKIVLPCSVVILLQRSNIISLSMKALLAPDPVEEAEDADADVVSVDIEAVIAQEAETEE